MFPVLMNANVQVNAGDCSQSSPYITALADKSTAVRNDAVIRLGLLGQACSVGPLINTAMSDPNRDVRIQALRKAASIVTDKFLDSDQLVKLTLDSLQMIASNTEEEKIVRDTAVTAQTRLQTALKLRQEELAAKTAAARWTARTKRWAYRYRYGIFAAVLGASAGGIAWHFNKQRQKSANIWVPSRSR